MSKMNAIEFSGTYKGVCLKDLYFVFNFFLHQEATKIKRQ